MALPVDPIILIPEVIISTVILLFRQGYGERVSHPCEHTVLNLKDVYIQQNLINIGTGIFPAESVT
jgi:hypothetical protein